MEPDDGPVVEAAITALDVLDAVRRLDEPGVSAIARDLDRSKSGVHKHLRTLRRRGFLSRVGDGYAVGLGVWATGTAATERFPLEEGARTVDSLAASIDHSVAVAFHDDGTVYVTYRNCSPALADRMPAVGDRLPLHATAAGKAVLAYLPTERRDPLLAGGDLARFTGATVTDPADLRAELEAIRGERTATERGDHADGVASVAAPITDVDDRPVGAMAVFGDADDLDEAALDGRLLSLVVNAARSVENAMAGESV